MDRWNVDWCLEDRELRLSRDAEKQEEIDFFLQKLRNIFSGYPHFGVPREPTPVAAGVYIGTTCDAENLDVLTQLGIVHVINCCSQKNPLSPHSRHNGADSGIKTYLELQAKDTDTYNILPDIRRMNDYINRARKTGSVLVCCSGASRSAAIAMGYLLCIKRMTLLAAAKLIKDLRRVALGNENFMLQIVMLAREEGMLELAPERVKTPTYWTARDRKRLMDLNLPEIRLHKELYKYRLTKFLH